MSLKLNKNELSRWKNYSWGHDGDLAKNQKFLTALQKQNHLKVVIRELNERIEKLENEREEIVQTIYKFSGLNQKILKLKYIDGLTLEAIANETGYTHQYIKNKHAELMRIIKFDRS
jgi:DNA-directed RNA polymerase specialized sigma subunit